MSIAAVILLRSITESGVRTDWGKAAYLRNAGNYQPSNASLRVSKGLRSFSVLVSQTERMMQNASAPPTARKPPITFSLILGAHQALGEVVVERDAPVGEEP